MRLIFNMTIALVLFGLLGMAIAGQQKQTETIDISEIHAGMKGYGLTVFAGTKIERFDVEVVDVVPNFMLRQPIILIKCHHPITDQAGVIGGMSGSPIYLDGRLAGALAYGWRFTKEALAGVTPIANMRAIVKRRNRHPQKIVHKTAALLQNPAAALKERIQNTFFGRFENQPPEGLKPAATPLSLAGFSGPAHQLLSDTLAPFGMIPTQGGGGGGSASSEAVHQPRFQPGSAIGVQMISGDLSATGIGTVTEVAGQWVLAFGHPMFDMGESHLPVTTARIHTVIPSFARSNKLGSPIAVAGALMQDRAAGIAARQDRQARTIPVSFHIKEAQSGLETTYHVSVADRQWLTNRLIHAAVVQFISHAASDIDDVTATITARIAINGKPDVVIDDIGTARTGLGALVSYFRPTAVVQAILANPFEQVQIDRIDFDVQLQYNLKVATLTGVYMTAESPAPGESVNLNMRLNLFGNQERIITMPITIPNSSRVGEKITLTVGGGNAILPPLPRPENLDDLLQNVRTLYPANALVAKLETRARGVTVRGKAMLHLPQSVTKALKPVAGSDNSTAVKSSQVFLRQTDTIINGKQTITFTVGKRLEP